MHGCFIRLPPDYPTRLHRHCEGAATNISSLRGAQRRSNPCFLFRCDMDCFAALAMTEGYDMDCFAEPVIGRRFAPTRWLAMTEQRLPRPDQRQGFVAFEQ